MNIEAELIAFDNEMEKNAVTGALVNINNLIKLLRVIVSKRFSKYI